MDLGSLQLFYEAARVGGPAGVPAGGRGAELVSVWSNRKVRVEETSVSVTLNGTAVLFLLRGCSLFLLVSTRAWQSPPLQALPPPPHGFFLTRCACSGNWGSVLWRPRGGGGRRLGCLRRWKRASPRRIPQSRQQAGVVGPPPRSHQWGFAWKMFCLFTQASC